MRYVSDVYAQEPVSGPEILAKGNGVVKVARVGRVNCNNRVRGQVFPAAQVGFAESRRRLPRFLQNVVWKFVGKLKFSDGGQRIHAGLPARPQYLRNYAFAAFFRRREADHFDNHFVIRPGSLGARIADKDAMAEHCAVDSDQSFAVTLQVGADKLPGRSVQHAQNLADRAEVTA